jgi:flagellar hook-basal body complex protein FliE
MASPILPSPAVSGVALPEAAKPGSAGKANGFYQALEEAIEKVDRFQQEASQTVQRFLSGEAEEVHSTVLATQRAELSLDLFLQVRNKVVQAYQEVMRMQL